MRATIISGSIALNIPITNEAAFAVDGTLVIELVDPKNEVLASTEVWQTLKPGRNVAAVSLSRTSQRSANEPLLWYRIRYRFMGHSRQATSGVVALGAIAPEMFAMVVAHPSYILPGHPFQLQLHTANPVTRRAVAGAALTLGVQWNSQTRKLDTLHAVTNATGCPT